MHVNDDTQQHKQALLVRTWLCFTVHLYQHHRLKNCFLPQQLHLLCWHWRLQASQTPTQTGTWTVPCVCHVTAEIQVINNSMYHLVTVNVMSTMGMSIGEPR